jgi:hypothetical protein
MRLEELGQLKKIHLIGTRTRDLPACSVVPQPTTLPRAIIIIIIIIIMALQLFVGPWPLFQFLDPIHSR